MLALTQSPHKPCAAQSGPEMVGSSEAVHGDAPRPGRGTHSALRPLGRALKSSTTPKTRSTMPAIATSQFSQFAVRPDIGPHWNAATAAPATIHMTGVNHHFLRADPNSSWLPAGVLS